MTCLFCTLSRRNLAAITLAAGAVAVSACSSAVPGSPLSNHSSIKPTTSSYNLTPVNYPGANNTQVTGINNSAPPETVGFSYDGYSTSTNVLNSFTLVSPYGSGNFTNDDYPDSKGGTALWSITTPTGTASPVEAGWVNTPGVQCQRNGGSIWGVVDDQGLWSLIPQYGGVNDCATTSGGGGQQNELYGVNDADVAVGYFIAPHLNNGKSTAAMVSPGDIETPIQFPMSSWKTPSKAYGINDNNDMVGNVTISGVTQAWYAINCPIDSRCTPSSSSSYCFHELNIASSTSTTAYAINRPLSPNSPELVAGSYTDGSGKTYGFVYSLPITGDLCAGSAGAPYTFEASENSTLTVVSGINNVGDIVGWYNEESGGNYTLHGFFGSPNDSHKSRRRTSIQAAQHGPSPPTRNRLSHS
jgi:hypothetical protein